MNRIRLIYILIISFVLIVSCKKIGDDDPFISFRSRDKRLIGDWSVTSLYFYNGKLSGVNNSGDPQTYFIRIDNQGKYYFQDTSTKEVVYAGNWWWVTKSQKFENKERFILNDKQGPYVNEHILDMLKFKEIHSKEFFDPSDLKREMQYTWKRIKD